MKRKDWVNVAVIAVLSGVLSYGLSTIVIGSNKTKKLKVEVVNEINKDFNLPSDKYFNAKSYNPTKEIIIGNDSNSTPFKKN